MIGQTILRFTKGVGFILIFLNFIIPLTSVYSQQRELTFEHISIDKGSNLLIWSIIQDKMGYMCFGTFNGLERYDGYDIVSYKYDFDDTSSINNPFVSALYEDKAGVLWVGTWYGLEKFDRKTGNFRHYTPNPLGYGGDLSNQVHAIQEDKYGVLWVGTGNGLYKFGRNTGKFTCLRFDSTDIGSINHNCIQAIYEDKKGSIWIGTGGGLDKLDFETGKFEHYWNDPGNRKKTWQNDSKYWINSICEDDNGTIWMGTNGGIVEFNSKSGTFTNYLPNPNEKQILKDNCITSICVDSSGVLWLGTWNGLYAFDIKSKKFIGYYSHDSNDLGSISSNVIYSVHFEKSGTLWIGTFRGGVNKLNLTKNPFKRYSPDRAIWSFFKEGNTLIIGITSKGWIQFDPSTEKIVKHSSGQNIFYWRDDSGNFWFQDKKGRLYKKDKQGNIIYFYDISGKIFNKPIYYIYKAKEGFWIGTDQYGLHFLDPITQRTNEVDKITLGINVIYEDSFGLIWVGTWMGKLLCINQKHDIIDEFISDPKIPGSISGKQIQDIYEDKKGRLWFATNAGLNRYNRLTKKFTHFTEKNGLLTNEIGDILEDDNGVLWLSTNKGISKFDPEKNEFKNFYISDWTPLLYNRAVYNTSCKTANGEMYFVGNGFVRFHPDSIKNNPFVPPIVITSFKKFDHPYLFDKEVRLSYNENFISFEFAALSFIDPEKNQYAYKMEGLDKDWIYSGTRRYASYPNLDPGQYTFRVKGSNNDGVWNEAGISISIIISPPWWKTTWSYILYSILILSAIYFIWKMQVKRIKMTHEYEMSRFEAEKLHEVDQMKSRFFTNISHEFRTPLTLILGPVKQIIGKINDEKIKDELKVVHKNANRLLGLVNQLLDISKLESGRMKLQTTPRNIVSLIKALTLSFTSYAERKRITLKFNSTEEEIVAYIDKDKIEKIITNVLSNAFKFTPDGGRIEVSVKSSSFPYLVKGELKGGFIEIVISDTGVGISKEKLPKIFDRFYQVDGSHTREQEGTGIGLSLTKELVELHKGKIEVESDEGKGTTFTISIPLGKGHLKPEEIVGRDTDEDKDYDTEEVVVEEVADISGEKKKKIDFTIYEKEPQPLLLLVEDNSDVRNYIKNNIKKEFRILEAVNGDEGWNKCIESPSDGPDLIVSDVMMPKMDGFELCEKIKNDERTSHIPVILLTAKAASSDKIEGYKTGADDYIMKPFEPEELKARIENLIEQRKRIHEHFKKHGLFEIDEKNVTPVDQRFLQSAIEIINKNLADPGFNVEKFADNLALHRSLLHRKFVALVGESPVEFIRRIRLTKAAEMIEANFGNLSEIALEVGFNNPAYFSDCFKKQFGIAPSQYKKNKD